MKGVKTKILSLFLSAVMGVSAQASTGFTSDDRLDIAAWNKSATPLNECFREHLKEAIRINKERRPLYRELSHGLSVAVSNQLINLERLSLIGTFTIANYDLAAKEFQAHDINLVCDEYVSMQKTPAFAPHFSDGAPLLSDYRKVDGAELRKHLKRTWRDKGLRALYDALKAEISSLEQEPRFHCLLRHVLQSMARVTALAPVHEREAKEKDLRSPLGVSNEMLKGHFLMLSAASDLDDTAAPVQALDVPILCQDVPHIPVPEFNSRN